MAATPEGQRPGIAPEILSTATLVLDRPLTQQAEAFTYAIHQVIESGGVRVEIDRVVTWTPDSATE